MEELKEQEAIQSYLDVLEIKKTTDNNNIDKKILEQIRVLLKEEERIARKKQKQKQEEKIAREKEEKEKKKKEERTYDLVESFRVNFEVSFLFYFNILFYNDHKTQQHKETMEME